MRAVRRLVVLWASVIAALSLVATASAATLPDYVQPYGTNDAGGFYNVLPPGEAGVDNALQLGQYQLNGTYPPNFMDQLPLYDNLVYASPTLTTAQIPLYFKDATFGTQPQNVARTESPEAGLTIVRDQYDVAHVYGQTRAEVEFGAGYAAAADRLFLMDVLRHVSEASLSSFVGGSAGDQAMDQAQWTVAPYTQADLQSQVDNAPKLYGAGGTQVVDDVTSYVAGINAYISAALTNPQLLPAEYAAIGKTPTMWQPTDVLALASLIGAIFGKGGGNEVQSALALQTFEHRFGTAAGRKVWSDFRESDDPESPTTVARRFPYETTSPFATKGLAMPVPGSVTYVAPGQTNPDTAQIRRSADGGYPAPILGYTATPDPIPIPADGSIGSALLYDLYGQPPHASNWELVNAAHSTNGHSIAVMGPQVGYYLPQILMEEDLHGPGIDARGAAFPGVNLYVELGHGVDYAWSATTADTDNVDTFAEVLCNPNGGAADANSDYYLYKGKCTAMDQLVRQNSWTPNVDVTAGPGSATLTTYRTVHGLVYARGRADGKYVAFTSARTTYFHEADSALGFMELNEPGFTTGPKQFQQAASNINFGFNWAYVDANHIAYYESGWFPQRAPGTSPDFPILGTGRYDWRGFDPSLHTETDIPFAAHPQAIDPTLMVSWNNKQAPGWHAADDNYGYGSVFRNQLIAEHIKQDLAHGKVNIAQLVQAMDLAATEDLRIVSLWPTLRAVLGHPANPTLRADIAELSAWYAHGGHRWDLAKTGNYSDNAAIELMDAWWPKLLGAEFHPVLGAAPFTALRGMMGYGSAYTGGAPNAPDYERGWWGYVSKDLRDLLHARLGGRAHPKPAGAYSRLYCGRGSLTACRKALWSSLLAAGSVTPASMYGFGDCTKTPTPECFDMNASTIVSGLGMAPFVFQNRPTFQQVVELTRTLPR